MGFLKKLYIQNFESHKDTVIEFDPGINAITGQSDAGKSGTFRALVWNFRNKPAGFSFRRNPPNRGDATTVTTEFEDATITRSRGTAHNTYQVGTGEVMDAVRSDTPMEVLEAVNLGSYNIQRQHDKYFLLQETPGEVAKLLNKIVGLDKIRVSLKRVNAIHTKADSDGKHEEEKLDGLQKKFKDMAYIDKLEKLGKRINKDLTDRDNNRIEYKALLNLMHEINVVEESIKASEDWLLIKEGSNEILNEVGTLRRDINRLQGLKSIVNKITTIDREIEQNIALLELKKYARGVWAIKEEKRKTGALVDAIKEITLEINEGTLRVAEMKHQHAELIKEIESCPVCRVPITTGAHRQLIIDYFEEH